MSRKGGLSNGGWLTVIAKAHLPADVLLWLDMSVFLLWLKREGGKKAQMHPASFPLFFFLFSLHPQAKSEGCILFCQSAGMGDIQGFVRCQLPFTCYLEDATFSKELCHVIGVCAVRGKQVSNGLFCFHTKRWNSFLWTGFCSIRQHV